MIKKKKKKYFFKVKYGNLCVIFLFEVIYDGICDKVLNI